MWICIYSDSNHSKSHAYFLLSIKQIQCAFFAILPAVQRIPSRSIRQHLNVKRNFHLLVYICFALCAVVSSCLLIKCVYNGYKVHLIRCQLVFEIDIKSLARPLAHAFLHLLAARSVVGFIENQTVYAKSRHWNIGTDINLQHQLNILWMLCFVFGSFIYYFPFFLFSTTFFLLRFYPIENVPFILRFMLFHHWSHAPFHKLYFLHDKTIKYIIWWKFYSKHVYICILHMQRPLMLMMGQVTLRLNKCFVRKTLDR